MSKWSRLQKVLPNNHAKLLGSPFSYEYNNKHAIEKFAQISDNLAKQDLNVYQETTFDGNIAKRLTAAREYLSLPGYIESGDVAQYYPYLAAKKHPAFRTVIDKATADHMDSAQEAKWKYFYKQFTKAQSTVLLKEELQHEQDLLLQNNNKHPSYANPTLPPTANVYYDPAQLKLNVKSTNQSSLIPAAVLEHLKQILTSNNKYVLQSVTTKKAAKGDAVSNYLQAEQLIGTSSVYEEQLLQEIASNQRAANVVAKEDYKISPSELKHQLDSKTNAIIAIIEAMFGDSPLLFPGIPSLPNEKSHNISERNAATSQRLAEAVHSTIQAQRASATKQLSGKQSSEQNDGFHKSIAEQANMFRDTIAIQLAQDGKSGISGSVSQDELNNEASKYANSSSITATSSVGKATAETLSHLGTHENNLAIYDFAEWLQQVSSTLPEGLKPTFSNILKQAAKEAVQTAGVKFILAPLHTLQQNIEFDILQNFTVLLKRDDRFKSESVNTIRLVEARLNEIKSSSNFTPLGEIHQYYKDFGEVPPTKRVEAFAAFATAAKLVQRFYPLAVSGLGESEVISDKPFDEYKREQLKLQRSQRSLSMNVPEETVATTLRKQQTIVATEITTGHKSVIVEHEKDDIAPIVTALQGDSTVQSREPLIPDKPTEFSAWLPNVSDNEENAFQQIFDSLPTITSSVPSIADQQSLIKQQEQASSAPRKELEPYNPNAGPLSERARLDSLRQEDSLAFSQTIHSKLNQNQQADRDYITNIIRMRNPELNDDEVKRQLTTGNSELHERLTQGRFDNGDFAESVDLLQNQMRLLDDPSAETRSVAWINALVDTYDAAKRSDQKQSGEPTKKKSSLLPETKTLNFLGEEDDEFNLDQKIHRTNGRYWRHYTSEVQEQEEAHEEEKARLEAFTDEFGQPAKNPEQYLTVDTLGSSEYNYPLQSENGDFADLNTDFFNEKQSDFLEASQVAEHLKEVQKHDDNIFAYRPSSNKPPKGLFRGNNKTNLNAIEPINVDLLRQFMSPIGQIYPRAITGLSRKHQRKINNAVRRARHLGFFSSKRSQFAVRNPFVTDKYQMEDLKKMDDLPPIKLDEKGVDVNAQNAVDQMIEEYNNTKEKNRPVVRNSEQLFNAI